MSDATGSWGLYPFFAEDRHDLVHPEDRDRFLKFGPYGKVFERAGETDGYLILQYGAETFRVRPDLFRPVPSPAFRIGQTVRERAERGTAGVVVDIHWHHKNEAPMYFLAVGGKRKSRRYWQEELVAADAR